MPRPRLTPEELAGRIIEYCERYGVDPNHEGMPPFPAGRRETRQHRDWIAVYKAHNRLARRRRGQCERCPAPASDGSVFCVDHRAEGSKLAARQQAPFADRGALLRGQAGRCPACGEKLELRDSVDYSHATDGRRAVLHPPCARLVDLVGGLGPERLEKLRAYLWPERRT